MQINNLKRVVCRLEVPDASQPTYRPWSSEYLQLQRHWDETWRFLNEAAARRGPPPSVRQVFNALVGIWLPVNSVSEVERPETECVLHWTELPSWTFTMRNQQRI
jgi:hypothetical protein